MRRNHLPQNDLDALNKLSCQRSDSLNMQDDLVVSWPSLLDLGPLTLSKVRIGVVPLRVLSHKRGKDWL
jgi:hypothetical protein